jgi:hypothetical protein
MAIKRPLVAKDGLDNNGLAIINVGNPVNDTDATNKAFTKDAGNISTGTLNSARLPASGVSAATVNNSATSVTPITFDTLGRATSTGSPVTITPAWSNISSKPTTIAGFGISDAYTMSQVDLAISSAVPTWASLSGKPTTISGYAITDAYTKTEVDTALGSKASLSGASFSGNVVIAAAHTITITDAPTSLTDGANKGYVDGRLSGLVWYNPVEADNLIGVSTTPIGSPLLKDVYIVGTGGNTGDWAAFSVGDTIQYQGVTLGWVLIDHFSAGDRYGISFGTATVAIGALSGHDNEIAILGGTSSSPTFTFEVPSSNHAVFVRGAAAYDFGKNFMYDGSSWIEFGGPTAFVYGTGVTLTGRTISVLLGAGVAELPSNEVGIDVYSTGGLMTTVDGTTSSTLTNAQLSLTKVGTAGTYKSVTTDAYGRITSGSNPTTLSGYGITDAQPLNSELTAIAALSATAGFVKKTGAGTYSIDTSTYLTANQTITLTGDVTGSGNGTFAATLANTAVTPGTYDNATTISPFTVDSKGRITNVGTPVTIAPAFSSIASKPTTLSGYGITDALSTNGTLPLSYGQLFSATLTTSTTTADQIVDAVAIASYRTSEYLIQVTSGSAYQCTKVIIVHDGTLPYLTEYATVMTGASLASFDATVASGNVNLTVTPVNAVTAIKVIRTTIKI